MKLHYPRLYFIDVIRAFAIIMMLQGHFIDGLMDPAYRDDGNHLYTLWKYFRGITAPTFFTVAGFIFMYLLLQENATSIWKNLRVQKGIKRGGMLIGIGYLIRINFPGLLNGQLYESFYRVDVLQCIGLSILCLTGMYAVSYKRNDLLAGGLLLLGTGIFLFEPLYSRANFDFLPQMLANFFTNAHGSVFTIFPWLGYVFFGAFAAVCFQSYKTHRYSYPFAIAISLGVGLILIFLSSPFFWRIYELFELDLARRIVQNNYLFIRLGNVLIVFAVFMILRNVFTQKTLRTIGRNTLSIYVIHFILLYGSFTGLGLYTFFKHALPPYLVIPGALLFIILVVYLSFTYNRVKPMLLIKAAIVKREASAFAKYTYFKMILMLRHVKNKITRFLRLAKPF